MKKVILLFPFLVFCFCSAFSQVKTYYFTDENFIGGFFDGISDNGKYIIGTQPSVSGLLFVRDSEELIRIFSPTEGGEAATEDVSDDGTIVGLFTDPASLSNNGQNQPCEVPGLYNYKENSWTALSRPEDVVLYPGSFSGSACSISADGKLIGGYLPTANKKFIYNGIIWNGDGSVRSVLPDPQFNAGAKINSISNDGSVACGWLEDSMYGKIAIWENGRLLTIDEMGNGEVVSPNGKYIGGIRAFGRSRAPFIWSKESGFISIDWPANICAGGVSGVSNDGRIIVGRVDFNSLVDHHPFIIVNGTYYDFNEYMLTKYGIKGPMGESFFSVSAMSADASVLCGFSFVENSRIPWILIFDEPLSIENKIENLSVNVYPNPASEILNITGAYTSAILYDNLGNCISRDDCSAGTMNVSTFEKGIYLVKVIKDNASRIFKVSINH